MDKLFKNFVLCGEIDYFCLLCNESFMFLDDVEKHVRWETHRKLMKRQVPFTKFKKDSIFKFGENFYCELCNYITPNMESITAHIREQKHKNAKTCKTSVNPAFVDCKRDEATGFVIVSDIIVNINQWHTFEKPKFCLLCNKAVQIRHVDRHLVSDDHIIKLTQARVVLEKAGRCYRKINEDLNFCFLCKKSISTMELNAHWDSQEHCYNMSHSISRMTKTTVTKMDKGIYKTSETKRKAMEMQKLLYNINLTNMTASCKSCGIVVPFLGRAMLNHQKDHVEGLRGKDDSVEMIEILTEVMNISLSDVNLEDYNAMDKGRRRKELAIAGKNHHIKLVPGGAKGYCSLCNIYIPSHFNTFKQHITGARHIGLLEYKGYKSLNVHVKQNYNTKPLNEFIKSMHHAHPIRTFWINKEISMHTHSFVLVCPIVNNLHFLKTRCYACDVLYTQGEDEKHYRDLEHKTNLLAAEVITAYKDEFLREIRTDLYHCGFCNREIAYWDNLKAHLRTRRHKKMKKHRNIVTDRLQNWLKDNMMSVISSNLDIMYLQMLELGIFCL